jgi:glycosyltransferase involved in cell wall biosynthesis
MSVPAVSVVMPVFNAARYLDESIRSITRQSFADFEFIIRDDGSTDGSRQILRTWAAEDSRIRLFEGEQLGPSGSSNWVVRAARAPLIARMDADDVAYQDRLRRQVGVLTSEPGLVLLGTMADTVDRDGRTLRPYDFSRLARSSHSAPFPHASIMFRKETFERIGGYRAECEYWEDLDLYLRMAEVGQIGVLAEPLLAYRVHMSTRLTLQRDSVERSISVRYSCMEAYAKGGNYDALLSEAQDPACTDKLHPRLFVALGSMELWSGGRPNMVGRMLRRGTLKCDFATLQVIAWAVWAWLSPATLRWTLKNYVRARNVALKRRVNRGRLYEWNPRPRPTGASVEPARLHYNAIVAAVPEL